MESNSLNRGIWRFILKYLPERASKRLRQLRMQVPGAPLSALGAVHLLFNFY